ncbi:C69 family dipeptidase [Olegusella massiliensis]|uniref:C69 family dipeptidase n=1 Tax=Olegusella massiliensis TaxID=1776381 RepID=UPI0023F9016F|nr:C69 family dipeptidase [Olegusella massiliensis]
MITTKKGHAFFKTAGKVVALVVAILMALPIDALACTQVYIGPNVTDNGNVYVGRSEDYAPRHTKVFGIQEPQTNPTFTSAESNFSWTYSGTTHRHTFVRDMAEDWDGRKDAYSEAGTNDAGVSVSATLTTDYNRKVSQVDPCGSDLQPESGIGEYTVTDVLLGCSSSAREAVELLGSIIDEHGNYDCNQIIIADASETWVFMQLSGHQWCAVNLTAAAPDKVSVNPNMGNLKFNVDLNDPNICVHSAKLEQTVKDAGTATYFDAEKTQLDVASSYGDSNPGPAQFTRYAQGHAYFGAPLAEGTYTMGTRGVTSITDPQLLFTPGKTGFTLMNAMKALCARGEGTDFDANTHKGFYSIGNNRNVEGNMFQVRQGMSSDIATIQWENLSRVEFGLFIPSYSALLTEVDTDIYPTIDQFTGVHTGPSERKDSVATALDPSSKNRSLDYVIMDINTLAYNTRAELATPVRRYLDALQNQLITQQNVVDNAMQATPAGDERSALANLVHKTASQGAYQKLHKLLDEMRTWYKGDRSSPFVPSDWDENTSDLKEPIYYATAAVAPVVTSITDSMNVEPNKAAELKVSANIPDDIKGSDQFMQFAWFNKATGKKVSEADSVKVDTSKVSVTEYYAVVTNTVSGKSVTTDPVTVTVKAAPISYKMLKDPTQVTMGEDANFVSEADFNKFVEVRVDNKLVDPANYSVKSGSTDVVLKGSYTKTLNVGEHTLEIVSNDGKASAKFTVVAAETTKPDTPAKPGETTKPDTPAKPGAATKPHKSQKTSRLRMPQTGDSANIAFASAMGVTGMLLVLVALDRKRKIN